MKNKSTYSLLINADAEEKGRSIFETAVYGGVIACMAFSGWHLASTKITLPSPANAAKSQETMIATAPVQQAKPLVAARG